MFDPLAPQVIADPYSYYRALRETDPVSWDEGLGSWVALDYASVAAVLSDSVRFGKDFRITGEDVPAAGLTIQTLDDQEHTAVRALVLDAVRRRRQGRAVHSGAGSIVSLVVEQCAGLGSFDLVSALCRPIALAVICAYLGVPQPEYSSFVQASGALAHGMDSGLDPSRADPARGAGRYLTELVLAWSATADAGLLFEVMRNAERFGVPAATAANTCRAVLHAGFESVSRFLGLALLALLSVPNGIRRASTAGAVGELVRYCSPVQADSRVCRVPTTVGNAHVRRGDTVVCVIASANRDPAEFEDPDHLSFDRGLRRNLGLGRGAHACLGAELAHNVCAAVIRTVHQRIPGLRQAGGPEYLACATLRGLASLSVATGLPNSREEVIT